jgi:hypothetical protein
VPRTTKPTTEQTMDAHWFDFRREPAMLSDDGTAMHAWCFNCCRWELWKYARDQYGEPKSALNRKRP